MLDQSFKEFKPLRVFLNEAHHNTKATEQRKSELFTKLNQISKAFTDLIGFLDFSEEWFLILFVLRSHASLFAASTLATSTQLPDSYSAMRSILENTLYAFFMWKHREMIEPWLRRQENERAKKRVRSKFKIGTMIRELKRVNEKYGNFYETLYQDTIDYGAHPNVASILTNLEQIREKDRIILKLKYFNPDEPYLGLSIKHLCRIGVLSLKIYSLIWYHRLKLTDFFQTLDALEKGL